MAEETSELRARAQHLFAICDKEEKGFVTKRDMQRMHGEMPLEPEQLEVVFDSLDADGNGYLTFDEFIQGFGIYMESDLEPEAVDVASAIEMKNKEADEQEDDENFMELFDQLGGQNVFEDNENTVKQLWDHFRTDDPNATMQFEKFLSNVSENINSKEKEKLTMEEFIRIQNEEREEEMKRLYEEMERQIEEEKQLVIRMERMKESQLRNEMREEITKKDQLLQQLQGREQELQETLNRVQESEQTSKHELALLNKEKRLLESQLEIQTRNAEELQLALERLRRESVNERRQRAMAAFSVAENIAVEREGLVEQLHLLRNINTRLTDENDLREYGGGSADNMDEKASLAKELEVASPHPTEPYPTDLLEEDEVDDVDIVDLQLPRDPVVVAASTGASTQEQIFSEPAKTTVMKTSLFDELASALESPSSLCQPGTGPLLEERFRPEGRQEDLALALARLSNNRDSAATATQQLLSAVRSDESFPTSLTGPASHSVTWTTKIQHPRSIGVLDIKEIDAMDETSVPLFRSKNGSVSYSDSLTGYHDGQWTHRVQLRKRDPVTPSAVFKIIVLGESDVGKTSFIRRFCCDDFVRPSESSTVGIDLSVRCLPVGDGKQAALQFWDTAGKRNSQEKYRSISRQYLRKADGVIIMYDVTSETSFLHVRYWIDCIQEVAGEDVVCVLVGNKTDLLEQEVDQMEQEDGDQSMTVTITRFPHRVPASTAMQLAQSKGLDFFETSAKTGYMIQQAIVSMAAKLHVREKIAIEKIILNVESTAEKTETEPPTTDNETGKQCCRL